LDFVSDALSWGRRLRILSIVDDFTREALALIVDTSIGGQRLARELDAVIARRGKPLVIVSDNGTEMTSWAILDWAKARIVIERWRNDYNRVRPHSAHGGLTPDAVARAHAAGRLRDLGSSAARRSPPWHNSATTTLGSHNDCGTGGAQVTHAPTGEVGVDALRDLCPRCDYSCAGSPF
jgi:putative transposase